jgi:hypothetical protein
MTNCVLMSWLGLTSDCGHTPRTKATPIQYVPCFPFTVLYILHAQHNMKSWFTLSHQPVQGEVCNNGKITVKCTEAAAMARYGWLCTTIPWDANITAWSYKIAHWFQFLLQRTEPRCGWLSDNIFVKLLSQWETLNPDKCNSTQLGIQSYFITDFGRRVRKLLLGSKSRCLLSPEDGNRSSFGNVVFLLLII